MTTQPDAELLGDFASEARQYLPQILPLLNRHLAGEADGEDAAEAFRLAHSIKGVACMLGLDALGRLAHCVEVAARRVAGGPEQMTEETLPLVERTLTAIDAYLSDCLEGNLDKTDAVEALLAEWNIPDESAPSEEDFSSKMFDPSESYLSSPEIEVELPSFGEPSTADAAPMDDLPPELLEIFRLEAEDHLKVISGSLPELRTRPGDKALLQDIRRSAHTLKGSAAMVGFQAITDLAHRMEDLLDEMYEEGRPCTEEIVRTLFRSADALEDLASGRTDAAILSGLYAEYDGLLAAKPPAMETLSDFALPEPEPLQAKPPRPVAAPLPRRVSLPQAKDKASGHFIRVPIEKLDDLMRLAGELAIGRAEFEQKLETHQNRIEEIGLTAARLRRAAGKLETEYEARTLAGGPAGRDGFDDLEMDRYTDFHLVTREVSETTTDVRTLADEMKVLEGEFDGWLTRQKRLGEELNDKLTRARMVPLSTLSARLTRTVRNAADVCGKQVELVLEGENTELDKTVLEEMSEPLLHLLRNAVDHGLEHSGTREAAGKPASGTVRVRAFPEGTQIVLQVIDDGRGIDPIDLKVAAAEKGLIGEVEAFSLSDDGAFDLLFRPGFSTAKEVSEISGRGVGLDIVKSEVQRLKGTIAIDSRIGEGTTFTIRLPLTLAVMKALLVKAGGQPYAIPLGAVIRILRMEPDMADTVDGRRVVTVGEQSYPLLSLAEELGLRRVETPRPPIAIVRTGGREIALLVDQLNGAREIVVKNLGSHVRKVRGVAGATILGDGSVVLIVNPGDFAERTIASSFTAPASRIRVDRAVNVLVVDDSPSVRRVVGNIIQRAGWKSEDAKDGVEALEWLHEADRAPDAIVLDIEMPRMDGYEFLSTLRSMDGFRDIPVVMVTSRAGDKHRRKAMDLGANEYLVKPYQDDQLLDVIRGMMAEAQASLV